eukprot:m.307435 g.307435  ORF g.307435 m.307435 type:complete len:378 (-) comp16462_c0_seq4:389-1522(-)
MSGGTTAQRTCSTCKGPIHSWKTMPVSIHCSEGKTTDTGEFLPEELDIIKRFPLVTIEKWQGEQASKFVWEEDAWIAAATQIKKANPNASVNVWIDSLRIYTGWYYPPRSGQVNHTLNPDAKSSCSTGHFRSAEVLEQNPEYLLKNKSGSPALESWSGCHIYDFTKAIARDFWTNQCLNLTASGVIDGCGADASWQDGIQQMESWALDNATAEAWSVGHKQAMRQTMVALKDGLVIGKNADEVGDYVSAALHESCAASNDTILLLQNLTARSKSSGRRLVYQCHNNCKDSSSCVDNAAAFLIGAGEDHYFLNGGWTTNTGNLSDHWLPELFEPALGDPASDGVYNHETQTWTRSFASGTTVMFDTKTNKGTINWSHL